MHSEMLTICIAKLLSPDYLMFTARMNMYLPKLVSPMVMDREWLLQKCGVKPEHTLIKLHAISVSTKERESVG